MASLEERATKLYATPVNITQVIINGVQRTRDDFISGIVGHVFKAKSLYEVLVKTSELEETLKRLNVAKDIVLKLDVGHGEDDYVLHVSMKEKRWYGGGVQGFLGNDSDARLGFGGGITAQGVFPNMAGRGERANLSWSQGISTGRKEIIIEKPMGPNYSAVLGVSCFNYSGDVTLSGYKEIDNGLSAYVATPTRFGLHKVTLMSVWRQLIPLSKSTSFDVREQAGHDLKTSIKHELTYDTRDDSILPSHGVLFKLTQEIAGFGGSSKFFAGQLLTQVNQRLFWDKVVLQLGASAGHVEPLSLGGGDPPERPLSIMDKFFLGGPTSFRGFENKGVGPHSKDNALGSDFYWTCCAHLKLPLPGNLSFIDRFRAQLFVNSGNLLSWSAAESLSQRYNQHKESMRLSYGIGIVTNFIGAKLELNYCWPVWYQQQDKVQKGFQIGVSIGD